VKLPDDILEPQTPTGATMPPTSATSFLLLNGLKSRNLDTLMPPGSLLFLSILAKEDLQHYSMMRKIIIIP